jgi:hypothetical protein
MTSPLRLSFDVDCPVEHAFSVWTADISTWWPRDHTMSGEPEAVVIEQRVGGRIFERAPDGREHDWGVVTDWDPPQALAFSWHLGRPASAATDVVVRFVSAAATRTTVVIEHRGWERLAADADVRERTRDNWTYVVGCFADHASTQGGS